MLLLLDSSTNPAWNLAAEEYLLTAFNDSILRLWRNAPAIIVGRHQNTWAEVNIPYIRKHNIPVIRRLSGGGAVFHDLGNINYSFMEPKPPHEDASGTFVRCTRPILDVLNKMNVPAYLSGRNDLLIDGKKISGTAQCQLQGRVLLHGTLLYASTLSNLGEALQGPRSKFSKKAVPSTPSPVCNISSCLPHPSSVEEFMFHLQEELCLRYPDMRPYNYTRADLAAIESLARTKYRTDQWNWGEEPHFAQQMELKNAAGTLQLYYDLAPDGLISRVRIYGDYISGMNKELLEEHCIGCPPQEKLLLQRIV